MLRLSVLGQSGDPLLNEINALKLKMKEANKKYEEYKAMGDEENAKYWLDLYYAWDKRLRVAIAEYNKRQASGMTPLQTVQTPATASRFNIDEWGGIPLNRGMDRPTVATPSGWNESPIGMPMASWGPRGDSSISEASQAVSDAPCPPGQVPDQYSGGCMTPSGGGYGGGYGGLINFAGGGPMTASGFGMGSRYRIANL